MVGFDVLVECRAVVEIRTMKYYKETEGFWFWLRPPLRRPWPIGPSMLPWTRPMGDVGPFDI